MATQDKDSSFVNRQKSMKVKGVNTSHSDVLAGHAAAASNYSVTDLGTLSGGGTTQAFGIDEAGQLVGYGISGGRFLGLLLAPVE